MSVPISTMNYGVMWVFSCGLHLIILEDVFQRWQEIADKNESRTMPLIVFNVDL